jgi:SAM-dependent methyltransferase
MQKGQNMKKDEKNLLLDKIIALFSMEARGKVLDLGCGDGDYSVRLKKLGFDVIAADMDVKRFRYNSDIDFRVCDVAKKLSFQDGLFDYVLLAEVVEHLKNPYEVMKEISRVLKKGGRLILSTPNILSLKSRIRYLFEGNYEYFREPPLEQAKNQKEVIFNLHLVPYRYHELEYLLHESGFLVGEMTTSIYEGRCWFFLIPLIVYQLRSKERRCRKKNAVDYSRINDILLSSEILFGRHLIVDAIKQ